MDEAFLFLLALGFLLAVPTALVLAFVAWRRTRRLRELELRVLVLERAPRAAAPAPAPGASPTEPAVPSTTRAPTPLAPLAPIERTLPPPVPHEPASAATPAPSAPRRELEPRPAPAAETKAPEPTPPPPLAPYVPDPAERAGVDWERFVGVRGAAVVGGLVLALAGLLLVQHSIQQGWITPQMRVALAIVAGVASLLGSEWLWRRDYRSAGNALSGAGGVLVLGGLWAGYRLYGMFGFAFAFPGMALASVALAWLALQRPSRVVAVFGVLGGFATPLLVSLGSDRPLGLFGYLLALDVGLFALSRRRGWGTLGVLGALGSIAVFASWLGLSFDAALSPWALGFVAASSAALCLPALAPRGDGGRPPLAGAAVALAGSFPLALIVAARARSEIGLLPLAAVGAVLVLLAGLVARRTRFPALAAGASLGAIALVLVWLLSTRVAVADGWHLLAATALLTLVAHALVELDARARRSGDAGAAALLELGLAGVAVAALARAGQVHPLAALGLALLPAILLLRQAWLDARPTLAASAALPAGALAITIALTQGASLARPLDAGFSVALVGVPALFALHALLIRPVERRPASWLATALAALLGLCALGLRAQALRSAPLEFHAAAFGLLLVAGHAAGRRASTRFVLAATLLGAWLSLAWVDLAVGVAPLSALALAAAAPLGLALGPRADGDGAGVPAGPWIVAALAPLAWQPALLQLAFDSAGRAAHVAVPLSGAALALVLWLRARSLAAGSAAQRHAVAAAAGACAVLVALAPAFALERAHFATPALAGWLAACAWRARPHAGLATAACMLLLFGLPGALIESYRTLEELQPWERSGLPLVHWMSVLWLLPALLAGASARLFARGGAGPAAALCGSVALLFGFVALNLEVQDLFNEGPAFEIATARLPLRDFLTSCAWALYAFGLLVAGLRKSGSALRKASLVFLLAAVVKVFLHDLGTLTGLYRVGSLVGLAAALFAVSLCYQRFVFRRSPPAAGEPQSA